MLILPLYLSTIFPHFFSHDSVKTATKYKVTSQQRRRLPQTWPHCGKTPCCFMGRTNSFAKSSNTFRELEPLIPQLVLYVLWCENCSYFCGVFLPYLFIKKLNSWLSTLDKSGLPLSRIGCTSMASCRLSSGLCWCWG